MKATYLDHMGSDLTVVNAARVSFGKKSDWVIDFDPKDIEFSDPPSGMTLEEAKAAGMPIRQIMKSGAQPIKTLKDADKNLIEFLARGMTASDFETVLRDVAYSGWRSVEALRPSTSDDPEPWKALAEDLWEWRQTPTHWSPFAHPQISVHVKAPIFVARQLAKHQVGMAWNEVSRRYVDDAPEFYWPEVWRKRADDKKQGSSEESVKTVTWKQPITGDTWTAEPNGVLPPWVEWGANFYEAALESGICPEQARMILPQNTYTEWHWTGSLYAFSRVCQQRLDKHAQAETRLIAQQLSDIIEPLFPVSWDALLNLKDTHPQ